MASSVDLVGRAREIAAVDDLLRAGGGAVLLRGPAGIGKSALLGVAHATARARGMAVLPTAGVQSEARLPFAGLHALLRPVFAHVDALPAPQRDALLSAFGMSRAAAPDPFLIALAALELLAEVADQAPVVLLVDDAHWLDAATTDALAFVGRRLGAERVTLLVALRDGDERQPRAATSAIAAGAALYPGGPVAGEGPLVVADTAPEAPPGLGAAGLPELCLSPLDRDDAAALLDATAPSLDPERRTRILRAAAGNPLALVELPRAPAGATLPAGPAFVPLTARLEQAFAARASELPEDTRTLLLVAAASDGDALAEILRAATRIAGRPLTLADLTPAIAARLVDADGLTVRFRHPLVRSALHQAAPLARRHAAHAALADVLADQPDRRIWHRVRCATGPDEELATELVATAERAQRRGAADVALAALDRAARLTADPFRRGVRLLRTTELAYELGRPDVVAETIAETSGLALQPSDRALLASLREIHDQGAWADADPVRTFTDIAEQLLDADLADEAAKALMIVAVRVRWSAAGADVRERIAGVAARLGLPPEHPTRIAILALTDPFAHGPAMLDALAAHTIDPDTDPATLLLLGTSANALGAFDLAAAFLTDAATGLRRQGRLGLLGQAQTQFAWTAVSTGALRTGEPAADEAVRLGREAGEPRWQAVAQLAAATFAGLRGDEDRAEALTAEAEQLLFPTAALPLQALGAIARGKTALAAGRHADAFDHLHRVFDPSDGAFMPYVRSWALADLVDAAVHSGRTAEARAIVAEQEPIAAQSRSPALLMALAFARALVADDEHAEALFQEGLDGDHATRPLVRARMLLAYGAWLRRRRRVAESRAPLRAAREAFEALGLTTWAERARQELRASGETSRRRAPDARDELTPQEIQIAEMAAEGLTNREIGQRLYLSHRTVGSHLYRIFPKLGVSSRAELRRVLPSGDGEPVT